MVRRLPIFKGYTIDVRLREFRKAEPGQRLEIIDFISEEGMTLIKEMEAEPETIRTFQDEKPWEIVYLADKAMRHQLSYQRRAARQAAAEERDGRSE